jgi:hypothetical protein
MKKLLPIVILALCLALGGGAGFAAKLVLAPKSAHAPKSPHAEDDAHAESAAAPRAKKEAGHGGKSSGHDETAAAFVKFSRQFVVPADPDSRRALVIIDINIEVAPESSQTAYALEPKLRDACLAALLRLSAEGGLSEIMTSAEAAATLKAALLEATRRVLGEAALDVLITDIAVQAT